MTRDDIIAMAREAGGSVMEPYDYGEKPDRMILLYDELVSLAYRIAAAEREACAKVCDARYMGDNNREDMEARRCAAAIRARSHT